MLKVKETSAVEVYAHALDHGDRPVIHGAELDYDDVHDGVHYHADLLEAAEVQVQSALDGFDKTRSALKAAALDLAITVDLAEQDDRSPRDFATYAADLATYRSAYEDDSTAYAAFEAAAERRDALKAKAAQDAALKTHEVPA